VYTSSLLNCEHTIHCYRDNKQTLKHRSAVAVRCSSKRVGLSQQSYSTPGPGYPHTGPQYVSSHQVNSAFYPPWNGEMTSISFTGKYCSNWRDADMKLLIHVNQRPRPTSLVKRCYASRCYAAFIKRTRRTLAMTMPWRRHHKHCLEPVNVWRIVVLIVRSVHKYVVFWCVHAYVFFSYF